MKLLPATARYLQLCLLCLSTVFIISIWLELNHDRSLQSITVASHESSGDADIKQDTNSPDLPPLSDFISIIERPLFTSNRRPVSEDYRSTAAAGQISPESGPSRDFVLSGIVLTDDRTIALVQTSDHKLHRLEVGDNIGNWLVKEIRNKEIVLTSSHETRNLRLQVSKSPAPDSFLQRRRTTPVRVLSTRETSRVDNAEQNVKSAAAQRQPSSSTANTESDTTDNQTTEEIETQKQTNE